MRGADVCARSRREEKRDRVKKLRRVCCHDAEILQLWFKAGAASSNRLLSVGIYTAMFTFADTRAPKC